MVSAPIIYSEGIKNVAAGCNPMDLRRESQAAIERVVKFLSANAKTVITTAEIAQVTTISANGGTHIDNLIARAVEMAGKEGVIAVRGSYEPKMRLRRRACSSTTGSSAPTLSRMSRHKRSSSRSRSSC